VFPSKSDIKEVLCPHPSRDRIRERALLWLLLGLNATLTAAFVGHLCSSTNPEPPHSLTSVGLAMPRTMASAMKQSVPAPEISNLTNAVRPPISSTEGKLTTWREVTKAVYPEYISRLRAAGCPPEPVQSVVMADLESWFADKRLQVALMHDFDWWRTGSDSAATDGLPALGQALEEDHVRLMMKLLGPDTVTDRPQVGWWQSIALTGPALGTLSGTLHARVQEIHARGLEQQRSYVSDHGTQQGHGIALARMRDEFREELAQVLGPPMLMEFLLRYSSGADQLRAELREFSPSADEFRQLFAAVDPIDRQMQREVGAISALSAKQAERYEQQRLDAVARVLSPSRFERYTHTRKPQPPQQLSMQK
jgi:hypothetical protein